jgi:hypothetical protein
LRQVRPQLELLEARDCPAGPQVASMSIVPLSGTLVQVNGTVTDDVSAICTVSLTGVVQATTAVNPDGTFAVQATASALGQVTAVAQDAVTNSISPQFVAQFDVAPPEIQNFSVQRAQANVWTFTGTVVHAPAGNIPVAFGGPGNLSNAMITTNANGTFTLTIALINPPPTFTVSAIATDVWGQQSDEVCLFVNS